MSTTLPASAGRPRRHYTPRRCWMNDPNGLIHHGGLWHLFYQTNPFGIVWGHMSWGHATSANLLDWQEQPIAIAEGADGAVFSGSIVHTTPGLLVAIYTAHQPGPPQRQTQNLAISHDGGDSWTRHHANPVLDLGLAEFRDPKVFWHDPTCRWIMVVVLSDQRVVLTYASTDLLAWQHLGSFGPAGTPGAIWECPDLFPLVDMSGTEHWVLKVDVFEGAAAGGSGALAFIGRFDGACFTPHTDPETGTGLWQWVDYGRDFYAAASWTDAPAGRRVWIAWMNSHHYAAAMPVADWRGSMTLPRELALVVHDGMPLLVQQPVPEWDAARVPHGQISLILGAADPARAGVKIVLPDTAVTEVALQLDAPVAAVFRLTLRRADGGTVVLLHDPRTGTLTLDRSGAGGLPGVAVFAGGVAAPLAALHDLRLILDTGSIEVFANGGRLVITEQLLGTAPFVHAELHAQGTIGVRLST